MRKHNCKWNNKKGFSSNQKASVNYIDKEWILLTSNGMYEDRITINIPVKFCPFCGEKLK